MREALPTGQGELRCTNPNVQAMIRTFKQARNPSENSHEITSWNFQNAAQTSRGRFPFIQTDEKTGKEKHYAECPYCGNPIQLIGLDDEEKSPPYGLHVGHSIAGFPAWDDFRYRHCPYSDPAVRIEPAESYEPAPADDLTAAFYQYMQTTFDMVVMLLTEELGINGSAHRFWRRCLRTFLSNQGLCYPWLTGYNLPYVFAYKGMAHMDLSEVKFSRSTHLYDALKQHPNISLSDPDSIGYCAWTPRQEGLSLELRFCDHKRQIKEDGSLHESIRFCLDAVGADKTETVYETELKIWETVFPGMAIYFRRRRQYRLLAVAGEEMPDIQVDPKALYPGIV